MRAIKAGTRKVGDAISVYCRFDNLRVAHSGVITKITSKFVTVQYDSTEMRFHRATGCQVGFHWPQATLSISPEISK